MDNIKLGLSSTDLPFPTLKSWHGETQNFGAFVMFDSNKVKHFIKALRLKDTAFSPTYILGT